ncbi:hypothetical protein [Homoserinibacter sp. YIM 151385]|uniref:hypothetical protein n=1 Tax=Homoserinibacter sp. YIM 151385 TaxID=2985506 RepID=UPI0022F042C6|nr:hypothetical protein [Homoserinibacter sp. YIM 151385]WBU38265.1 hypothetical protein OF852_01385 [Homoserinibacter sp. YIM 151385]
MADDRERELRERMLGGEDALPSIDVDRVLRRARARRAPRVVAVSAVGVLAAVGIAVPVAVGGIGSGAMTAADERSDVLGTPEAAQPQRGEDAGAGGQADSAASAAAALSRCGAAPAPASSPLGLELTVQVDRAPAGSEQLTGTARLENTGDDAVVGVASAVSMTISAESTVLWHSNGGRDLVSVPIELAPGEQASFPVLLEPRRCGSADETGEAFREDLPPLPAGRYAASGALGVELASGEELVVASAPSRLELSR